jgi:hypothetical protein
VESPSPESAGFRRNDWTKTRKSPFESARRFGDPINCRHDAELSESLIHIVGDFLMFQHLIQMFRQILSDDTLECMTERAIRATRHSENCVWSSVQMTYDV